MSRIITFMAGVVCMIAFAVHAPGQTKIYLSIDSLLLGQFVEWPDVRVHQVVDEHVFLERGNDYRFIDSESKHRKLLKRDVFALEYCDSLYLNGRPWGLGSFYIYTERIGNRLFFSSHKQPVTQIDGGEVVAKVMIFGVLGNVMIGAIDALYAESFFYVLDIQQRELYVLNDAVRMANLLKPYPDLSTAYELSGKSNSRGNIALFLERYLERERVKQ